MRKLFFAIVIVCLISFFGCGKSVPDNPACTANPPSADSAALLKFAADSIKPTRDSSGLFYQIIDSGNANNKPNLYSNVTVNYVGRLMNGAIPPVC